MARRGEGVYQRGTVWYLDFRHDGQRHTLRIGRNIKRHVAAEIAGVKRAAILKGEAGIGQKRKDILFERAAEEFLSWARTNKKPRTSKDYRQCIDHLKGHFAGKRLGQILTLDVERYKRGRVDVGARVRVNRELAVLHNLLNRCKEWGLFEGENPAGAVKKIKEPKRRLRFLESSEEGRLLEHTEGCLRSVVIVGINTGLRIRSEALPLCWSDVDLQRGFVTVQAAYAKNGTSRSVPLNSRAREVLERLRERSKSEYVFTQANGRPYKSMDKPFAAACKLAKLAGVTLHTLRHSFASRLAMAGVDLRTIQDLGGWSDLSMVMRYSHLSPNHKREAIEKIVPEFHNAIHNTALSAV
ncbi:MAG: site-specific integrase [Nitrospirota bacterium]